MKALGFDSPKGIFGPTVDSYGSFAKQLLDGMALNGGRALTAAQETALEVVYASKVAVGSTDDLVTLISVISVAMATHQNPVVTIGAGVTILGAGAAGTEIGGALCPELAIGDVVCAAIGGAVGGSIAAFGFTTYWEYSYRKGRPER